ncbi:holo-ACP synthase [Alloscardovia criceti]|uniref:holo-ACP synthase n=1 Tax=Alloscardovia criceti TaxID=356828 RepID=UPI000684BCD5|nr:holo-ACP synthase [Alloscardovia criceti]
MDSVKSFEGQLDACIAGMGHDVVDCAAFEAQMSIAGSRFENLFSQKEKAQCRQISAQNHTPYSTHLATRWAGKEAFLKAWSHALAPSMTMPYTIDNFPWASIEILNDAIRRPSMYLNAEVVTRLHTSLGSTHPEFSSMTEHIHVSLSQDENAASAVVIIEMRRKKED